MQLARLFEPKTTAIFGVSFSNPFHPANVIYNKNHLRYKTKAYCINPSGGVLYGEKVYPSIREIPEKVDLAILGIRAEFVPQALRECVEAGVSGGVVISGGFSETGRTDIEDEIRTISLENEFPVIGPNCLGIFSPPHIDAFFLPHERLVEPRRGPVALLSQSGGILVDLMIKLTQEDVGISKAVSTGNKTAVDEVDLLRHLGEDPETRVVGIYIEGFTGQRGRTFVELMRSYPKPVIVLKSGKTPGGSRAVSSHTASLAGDYAVFAEVVRQGGAIEAKNETEFVSCCEALGCCDAKRVRKVCIITGSGGHGAMAADQCFSTGLTIVEVPAPHKEDLRKSLSASVQQICSLNNPIDLTGSAVDNDFFVATRFFLEKDYVDCLILLLLPYLPGLSSDVGARLAVAFREFKKPVIAYLPHVEKYGIFIDGFEANGIPVAHSVEGAVYMAKSLMRS
jgi:acyl-CoA synthetase (NDP forming)